MSKPFFELRIYKVFPDKADEWLEFMEKTIVPFQRLKGMDIVGNFYSESFDLIFNDGVKAHVNRNKDDRTYIWIRKFESKEQMKDLYKKVYESPEWLDTMNDKVGELIDRKSILVYQMESLPNSLIQ